ncbi:MAG: DUF3244 domain-containing protein [Odoribacter sp.]|nr:DUF3244 domain-containing protein [Odoribacter sp.]
MKAFKITLILIFSLLACQLLAADKGSNTTTQKPVIIDITVVYLPDFPLERTILPSFNGEVYGDYISVEADFPVGAVAVQVVDGGNQVVVEETVYFEGDAVRIHTEGLEQGEYQLVLELGSMTYKGLFRVN